MGRIPGVGAGGGEEVEEEAHGGGPGHAHRRVRQQGRVDRHQAWGAGYKRQGAGGSISCTKLKGHKQTYGEVIVSSLALRSPSRQALRPLSGVQVSTGWSCRRPSGTPGPQVSKLG